jgi:lipoprotein-releasing system permease protein
MDLPFELHVALRYLLAKRKQAFISVISLISTLGVTVGVMALVIALALMTGLQQELRDRILGSNPHIYVWNTKGIADYEAEADLLRRQPHVLGAAPEILGQGLISVGGETAPVQVKGIDPVLEQQVTSLKQAITSGSLNALTPREGEPDAILLGKDLAARLGVTPGDSVSLTMGTTLSPAGLLPRTRRVKVGGLFSLGLIEFDSTYAFMSLDAAKRMLEKTQVDLIQLRVDDIYAAPRIAEAITARLGSHYVTQDWADMNKSLSSSWWRR